MRFCRVSIMILAALVWSGSSMAAAEEATAVSTGPVYGAAFIQPRPGPSHRPPRSVYPGMAALFAQEGNAFFRICIDANGEVSELELTRSSGSRRLDDAAREYLSESVEYDPALRNGEPVDHCRDEAVSWIADEEEAERRSSVVLTVDEMANFTPLRPGPQHDTPREAYPEMSVAQSEEGIALADICVDSNGDVSSVEIATSSGHERLDQATREFLANSVEYEPATLYGVPVDYCRTEIVSWILEELQAERIAQAQAPNRPPEMSPPPNVSVGRDYPIESVRLREEGLVILRVCVAADGSVDEVELVESSGYPRLDDASIRMVTGRFQYNPATQNGVPIRHCQNQPIRWALGSRLAR